jgi:hypothetical protein
MDKNDDIYDEFNNIRDPIPSKSDILFDYGTENFEEFKNSILADETIDNDLKQILIQSRLDIIEKFENESRLNIEKAFRSDTISILIVKLKNTNYNKININQKKYIIQQIDLWIDGYIQKIVLESEILYEIFELIREIKFLRPEICEIKIKNIFEPKNSDDFNSFVNNMETIKEQSIKEEQDRINKLEEKNNNIKCRKDLVEILIINLNKLSIIDSKTKNLKEHLNIPINKYINLETDFIEINNDEIFTKFIEFVKSIRIEKKDLIINLIKKIQN